GARRALQPAGPASGDATERVAGPARGRLPIPAGQATARNERRTPMAIPSQDEAVSLQVVLSPTCRFGSVLPSLDRGSTFFSSPKELSNAQSTCHQLPSGA